MLTGITQNILRKMCDFAGIEYGCVNWSDGSHLQLTWTKQQQNDFTDWLANEINNSALIRRNLTRFPNLVKGKYRSMRLAREFVDNYGFRVLN